MWCRVAPHTRAVTADRTPPGPSASTKRAHRRHGLRRSRAARHPACRRPSPGPTSCRPRGSGPPRSPCRRPGHPSRGHMSCMRSGCAAPGTWRQCLQPSWPGEGRRRWRGTRLRPWHSCCEDTATPKRPSSSSHPSAKTADSRSGRERRHQHRRASNPN